VKTRTSPAGESLTLPRRGSADGFTLIELLVVIAISALVLAIYVPPLTRTQVDRSRVELATRTLSADLRQMRQRALSSNLPQSISFDTRGQTYSLPIGKSPRHIPIGASLHVSSLAGAEASEITFFPDGTSTGGIVTLASGQKEYRVSVSWPFGRVTVHD
jgi:general secretion pathway protein H